MRILPKAGYDVVVAGHREEAMTMVSHDRPDLIASDLLLPKMSGLDVLKGLRQSAGTASIPGDCSERVKRKEWNEAAERGATAYCEKSRLEARLTKGTS